ncbi:MULTISPECIES: glycosyltransferase [Chitinophagaceae]
MKILFITKHAVHEKMAMAGNQIFYHTLLSFCRDSRFDCAFLTVQKNNNPDLEKMRSAFGANTQDFSQTLPKLWTFFTYLFYRTLLRRLLSLLHPSWYLLDPVYRSFFKKAILNAKSQGFVPDAIVLEWTEVLFLLEFCKQNFPQAKIVVTEHDVTFVKLQRRFKGSTFYQRWLVTPFQQQELKLLQKADLVRVLSKDDRQILVDNHIGISKIRLVAPYFQKKNLVAADDIKPQIVFYGALNRSENYEAVQWFIEQAYQPFQLSQLVSFIIVGGGSAKLMAQYASVPGVRFTGYVEDPSAVFVESLCMVVPLLNGGGIKIKVLESMACSLPVLTNEIGVEGIGGRSGIEYIHCDTPMQYERAIKNLLDNPTQRKDIGNHARTWVNEHFDYQSDLDVYKQTLLDNMV